MAKNQGNGGNNAEEKQEKQEEVVVATTQASTETTPVVEPVKEEAATDVAVETKAAPAPVEEVVVATKEKTRKVQGIEDHKCHVGGKRYTIEKNKQQIVPEDVAMILQRGKKVIIL